jgi:nicotinamide-nucleotide amidase
MQAAVFSIGTELTRGELINSNAAWLSEQLTSAGFQVTEVVTVDDDRERIQASLRATIARGARIVVSTGGLGPTTDDLTTETVAAMIGKPMLRDQASLNAIAERFRKLERVMSDTNAKQADFPEGATIMPNPHGTAPGFGVEVAGGSHESHAECFFMPGVPSEMKPMFREQVLPRIAMRAERTSFQVHMRSFGLPESQVGEKLAGIEAEFPGVVLGYRAHFPEIEEGHESMAGRVAAALRTRGERLAVAESCTGGLLSHLLTRDAGASDVFDGGIVAYANKVKEHALGVNPALIEEHGAVSDAVACAMAEGVRRSMHTTYGLAVTGVAGPGGGSSEKPVGTVYIALAAPTFTVVRRESLKWDRDRIQLFSAYSALNLLRLQLLLLPQ